MFEHLVKQGRIKACELAKFGPIKPCQKPKPDTSNTPNTPKHKKTSKGETALAFQLSLLNIEQPVREHAFVSDRKWRFDFAWPSLKMAVEVEGVIHYGTNPDGSRKTSRHQTSQGYFNDCDKYNRAALEGWTVLRYTQKHISNGSALEQIELLYKKKTEHAINSKGGPA